MLFVTTTSLKAEEEEERGTWASPVEFILSCLGYAVGLGNVWRFPYMAYTNGGAHPQNVVPLVRDFFRAGFSVVGGLWQGRHLQGVAQAPIIKAILSAFLIPYAIMLTFVGLPVFLIELVVGQYSACGPMTVWSVSPLFQGIGAGMVVISFIGSIYYNQIIAWSLYYMFASFQKVLPWDGCGHSFNTPNCYSKKEAEPCEAGNGIWYNMTCYNGTWLAGFDVNETYCNSTDVTTPATPDVMCFNYTSNIKRELFANRTARLVSASEEYFNNAMLRRSDRIEDTGSLQWDLVLSLLLAWIICFLCVLKGIKSSGKVVYFTATFPYLLLVILFFRGVTLPGAWDGIKFFIVPKWHHLASPKVWADAAGQIFFSLSVGMGGLMTFASYNKFHNNVYRDTLIVTIGNCLTSVFAGFVIFSILGFMANELGVPVDEVAQSGSGLAFIAYPEVVTRLPISQLWSVLFFFMLLTLGLDSQFAGLENCQTAIVDVFPRLRSKKIFISMGLCFSMFILGLTMCTNAGIYWTELMSYYSSGWSLVLIGLAEAIVFPWVYGAKRLMDDIEHMVGFRIGMHWWFCWKFVSPILIIAVLIVNIIDFTPLAFGDYVLPPWAQGLGWGMALASAVCIPIGAAVRIYLSYQDPDYFGLAFLARVKKLTEPTDEWKPRIQKGKTAISDSAPPPYSSSAPSAYNENPAGEKKYENPAFDNTAATTPDMSSRF